MDSLIKIKLCIIIYISTIMLYYTVYLYYIVMLKLVFDSTICCSCCFLQHAVLELAWESLGRRNISEQEMLFFFLCQWWLSTCISHWYDRSVNCYKRATITRLRRPILTEVGFSYKKTPSSDGNNLSSVCQGSWYRAPVSHSSSRNGNQLMLAQNILSKQDIIRDHVVDQTVLVGHAVYIVRLFYRI